MKPIKEFEYYIKKGVVKKQSPNTSRANDLINESERKLSQIKRIINKIGIDNGNANDIIESCYDIIIYKIRAKMLLQGYNSSGFAAHEAEVAYLKNLGFNDLDISFVNQLRYFRNGILYYGKRFDKEYANKTLMFLNKIKEKLK